MYFSLRFFWSIFLILPIALFFGCGTALEEKTDTIELTSNVGDYVIDRQVNDPVLHDSAVYEFLNQLDLIGVNSVLNRNISDRSFEGVNLGTATDISENFSIYITPEEFLFDTGDSLYVIQQIENAKDKIWDLIAIDQAEIWSKYNEWVMQNHQFDWDAFKRSGFGCFVELGLPIFNKNHDRVIIYVGYQCHYTLGSGSIYEFRKVNGKWELNKEVNLWIS